MAVLSGSVPRDLKHISAVDSLRFLQVRKCPSTCVTILHRSTRVIPLATSCRVVDVATGVLDLRGRCKANVSELAHAILLWLMLSQLALAPNNIELEILRRNLNALRI